MSKTLYRYAKEGASSEREFKPFYKNLRNLYNNFLDYQWSYKNEDQFRIQFPFKNYSKKQQTEFINYLYQIIDSEEAYLEKNKTTLQPNKQLLRNFSNVDLDNIDWNKLKDYFLDKISIPLVEWNKPLAQNLFKQLKNKTIIKIRKQIIQNPRLSNQEKLNHLITNLKKQHEKFLDDHSLANLVGIENLEEKLKQLDYLESSSSDAFMQYLINVIIADDNLDQDKKIRILRKVKETVILIKKEVFNKVDNHAHKDIIKDFTLFLTQLNKRNQIEGYLKIISILEQEIIDYPELFKAIPKEYQSNQRWIANPYTEEEIISSKDLLELVVEGNKQRISYLKKNPKRFQKNCKLVKELIKAFRKYGGRNLKENYLQHFKGVYREVFESKIKINRRQTNTIVKNYLKKPQKTFDSNKEHLFVGEKISRAMFRDKGQLTEYREKNLIKLYLKDTTLKLYDYLQADQIFDQIYKFYLKLFKSLKETLVTEDIL